MNGDAVGLTHERRSGGGAVQLQAVEDGSCVAQAEDVGQAFAVWLDRFHVSLMRAKIAIPVCRPLGHGCGQFIEEELIHPGDEVRCDVALEGERCCVELGLGIQVQRTEKQRREEECCFFHGSRVECRPTAVPVEAEATQAIHATRPTTMFT